MPLVRAVPKTAVSWPLPGTPPVQLPDVLHVPLPLVFHVPLMVWLPDGEITRSITLPEDSLKLKLSPESALGTLPGMKTPALLLTVVPYWNIA